MSAENLMNAADEFNALRTKLPIGVLHSEQEYENAVATLDEIIDAIGEDEAHPLTELADTIGVFVEAYENEHHQIFNVTGVDVLKYLLEEHDLRQTDLKELGSQGVVSEILAGKRELNLRQVVSLARRFQLPVEVFI